MRQYSTYSGSTDWVIGYNNGYDWYVVNSNEPNKSYFINGLAFAPNVGGLTGLDNSFWVAPSGANTPYSVYNSVTDTFDATNIPTGLWGINTNGTVIAGMTNISCATTSGSPTGYTLTSLQNYVNSGNDATVQTQAGGLYIKMAIPGLYNGGSGMYKIHTENGLCEIHLDDYYTQTNGSILYESYAIVFEYVTSAANVYTGV